MPDISALLNDPKTVWIAVAIMAYFLFFGKKPVTPTPSPTPVDPVNPAPVVPTPDQRPIIDAIVKLIPTILPLLIPLLAKSAKEEAAKAEAEQAK